MLATLERSTSSTARANSRARRPLAQFLLVVLGLITFYAAGSANAANPFAPPQAVEQPIQGIYSLNITPAELEWGTTATGTIELMQPAPKDKSTTANGKTTVKKASTVTVVLKSSSASVKVPASVKFAQGARRATFKVTVSKTSACAAAPGAPLAAIITATYKNAATANVNVGQTNPASRYTSSTISIDFATSKHALVGISHDGLALVFDQSAPCVSSIVSGKVLFLKHLGVVKVLGVKRAPQNRLAVAVGSAAFLDFIRDGTFQIFSQQLGGSDSSPVSLPAGPEIPGADQWKYQVNGAGSAKGAIQYSFSASKSLNGLTGSVKGNGEVEGGYNFQAVFSSGKLQTVKYTTPTNGTLHVSWNVEMMNGNSNIGETRLKMPALWSSLVDTPDDFPMLFQLYANLIFHPGFGEKKAMVSGEFDVIYHGEGGFDTTQPVNNGLSAEAEVQRVKAVAMGAHGVVVAVDAPKLSLSLSTDSLLAAVFKRAPGALAGAGAADQLEKQLMQYYTPNKQSDDFFKLNRTAYVQWVASIAYAGPGSVSTLPCQQFYETFIASAGVDGSLLNDNKFGSANATLPDSKGLEAFKGGKTIIDPDIPVCRP